MIKIKVYASPTLTQEEVEQERQDEINGVVISHQTTHLEYKIPSELEDELSEMIDKRLEEFYKKCNCEECKQQRGEGAQLDNS